MNNRKIAKNALLILTFICSSLTAVLVGKNMYHPILIGVWSISIISAIASTLVLSNISIPRMHWTRKTTLICLVILLPALIRIMNYQPYRIHGDDLLTATFSQEFHPRTTNFFAGVPEGTAWVAKFPAPYFFLQKVFLKIYGATVLTVKLSVIPYVLIVSFMTYAIASMIFGVTTGVAAVVVYAFMAISLYHETLGLHFISSTALYLIFFYTLLKSFKNDTSFWFIMSGITAASCYLSYTSSYIAFPILVLAVIIQSLYKKRISVYRWIIWSLIGFFITIAPFMTYALRQENYFGGRINQVSLLTGSWSASKLKYPSFTLVRDILAHNTNLALRAMVYDGIGGHGGYTFNQKAFFHPLGLFLFLLGLLSIFFYTKQRKETILLLATIVISFITGVILTIPPPAYHRLTLIFPFIAIISAVPFSFLIKQRFASIGVWMTCIILAIFAGANLSYFHTAVKNEAMIDDAAIVTYINNTYPNRHIHIAAFPSFALEKIYPFFQPQTAISIDTKYHMTYLKNFTPNEPYLYIITLPNEFKDQFIAADPQGKLIPFSNKYWIMINEVPSKTL